MAPENITDIMPFKLLVRQQCSVLPISQERPICAIATPRPTARRPRAQLVILQPDSATIPTRRATARPNVKHCQDPASECCEHWHYGMCIKVREVLPASQKGGPASQKIWQPYLWHPAPPQPTPWPYCIVLTCFSYILYARCLCLQCGNRDLHLCFKELRRCTSVPFIRHMQEWCL